MRLIEVKKIKRGKSHKKDGLPEIYKTKKYIFKTYSCKRMSKCRKLQTPMISNPCFRPHLQNNGKILG